MCRDLLPVAPGRHCFRGLDYYQLLRNSFQHKQHGAVGVAFSVFISQTASSQQPVKLLPSCWSRPWHLDLQDREGAGAAVREAMPLNQCCCGEAVPTEP